jgi:hypothetical protein
MKKVIITALMLLMSIISNGQSAFLPQSGLVAFWPLDGNVKDEHLFGHHGIMGNISPSTGRFGDASGGMFFNGINTFVEFPSSVMGQVTGSFSVSIWVNPDTVQTHIELINDRVNTQYTFRFRIGYGYIGHMPTFHPDSAYFDLNANTGTQKVGAPKPNVEGWTHFVYVFDSTGINQGTIKAYWNGTLVGSRSNSTLFSGSRPINLGRGLMPAFPVGNRHFKGIMDDIAVWNRALSDSEVLRIYQSCQVVLNSHPDSQVVGFGGTANFQVLFNSPSAQYQWQINEGNGWERVNNSAIYSGAQTPNLTVTASSFGLSGNLYRCLVIDSVGCYTYSLQGRLLVRCQQGLSALPQFISSQVGMSETLQITGAGFGTVYQWQATDSTGWYNVLNGVQFTGAQSSNFTISGLGLQNNGQRFRCIVSYLGCNDTTNATLLEVNCVNLVVANPSDFTAQEGQAAAFVVESTAGQQYQWYRNDGFNTSAIQNSPRVTGANSDTLTIYALNALDHMTGFYCVVNGFGCSDTTSMAVLRIGNNTNVEEIALRQARVYPVPATDELYVEIEGLQKAVHANLFDVSGRKVLAIKLTNGRNIILTNQLARGQYYLTAGETTHKVVITR